MKKILFLALPLFLLFACNSDGELSLKDNYTFITTVTVTCSPSLEGYPQTTKMVTEVKDITAIEAKEAAKLLTYTNVSTMGGYTITQKSTCEYVLTKNYVAN